MFSKTCFDWLTMTCLAQHKVLYSQNCKNKIKLILLMAVFICLVFLCLIIFIFLVVLSNCILYLYLRSEFRITMYACKWWSFVFNSCLKRGKGWGCFSYFHFCFVRLFAYIGGQHILCCVFALFVVVLCALCCQFIRIVLFYFPFCIP